MRQTCHSHPSSHFEDEQPRDPLLPRWTETISNHIGEAPESPILLDDPKQQLEPGTAELATATATATLRLLPRSKLQPQTCAPLT
jgi:hypothetical protein